MGTYRAVESNHLFVRLVHEPITSGAEVLEFRNPSAFVQGAVQEGKRYIVSLSFSESKTSPAVAAVQPLPNTVTNEEHIAKATEATASPSTGEIGSEAVVAGANPEKVAEK